MERTEILEMEDIVSLTKSIYKILRAAMCSFVNKVTH